MHTQQINGDMKVWDVLTQYPETYEVFRKFGCPDMRTGFYSLSAHVMKVRWAAKMHHIELHQLVNSLNEAITAPGHDEAARPTEH
jgi:hypothetical protein